MAVGDIELLNDEQAISAAAETGQAAKIAENLENGMDTLLGRDFEGGTDLSGGQWQKLSIARAHYRGRGFVLLDEPTGNLDPLAEAEVFQKYMDLAQGRTLIMVTHRISVASLADRIVVFAGGRIAEDGTWNCFPAAANMPGCIRSRPSGISVQTIMQNQLRCGQMSVVQPDSEYANALPLMTAYSHFETAHLIICE